MARENFVMLIGAVQGSPVINEENQRARFILQTMRRTGKIDYPGINVLDKHLIPVVKTLSEGDFVVVKGFLATNNVKKSAICEHCSKKNVASGTKTEVIALGVRNIGKSHTLQEWAEMSNNLMVIGTLCINPGTRRTGEEQIANCQYQIAVNRSYIVKEQSATADYPWVKTTGEQAEQDALRLRSGSQIYIRGAVQTRNLWRNVLCSHCGSTFRAEDFVAEIAPYSVEYLNKCVFTPKNPETQEPVVAS